MTSNRGLCFVYLFYAQNSIMRRLLPKKVLFERKKCVATCHRLRVSVTDNFRIHHSSKRYQESLEILSSSS